MLKLIKQYAHKIKNREYYNELYVVPFEISHSEYDLIVDETIEDIIFNIEKYLNQPEELFKLKQQFKISIIVINSWNDPTNIKPRVFGTYSLISYRRISGEWKYIFMGEGAEVYNSQKLDVQEIYTENLLKIGNIKEFPLSNIWENFIYTEDGIIFNVKKYQIRYFLSELFYSEK